MALPLNPFACPSLLGRVCVADVRLEEEIRTIDKKMAKHQMDLDALRKTMAGTPSPI